MLLPPAPGWRTAGDVPFTPDARDQGQNWWIVWGLERRKTSPRSGWLGSRLRDPGTTAEAPGSRRRDLSHPTAGSNLRIFIFFQAPYRIAPDAIVIAEVFARATNQTPGHVIAGCE